MEIVVCVASAAQNRLSPKAALVNPYTGQELQPSWSNQRYLYFSSSAWKRRKADILESVGSGVQGGRSSASDFGQQRVLLGGPSGPHVVLESTEAPWISFEVSTVQSSQDRVELKPCALQILGKHKPSTSLFLRLLQHNCD